MGMPDKFVDTIMVLVTGAVFIFMFFMLVGAIFAPPQKDPCEQGYILMKGACVQGYWPGRER